MGVERKSVSAFQYASAFPLSATENIFTRGTTSAVQAQHVKVFVTDLKITGGTGAHSVEFLVKSTSGYDYGQPLRFRVATSVTASFTWEVPYKFNMAGTTGEYRHFVASSDGTGIRYAINGYIE